MKYNLKEIGREDSFVNFYSYFEDKWLQNAELKDKLIAVFGSVENALVKYKKDRIFK